jgi:hypothetical protein
MKWPNETLDQINTKKYEWNTLILLYFLLGSDKIWVTGTTLLCTVLEIKGLVITLQKSFSYLIEISYDFVNKIEMYFYIKFKCSQTCEQWPHMGPNKCGCYAEGWLKKISGK